MTKSSKKKEKNLKNKEFIPTDIEVSKKLLNIYQSAMDRKLEFDLSFESVKTLLKFPNCYYTGRKFDQEGPYARSIDRVDSSKGYVEGNVVSCTIDINGKKSNLSEEEIELLYQKIVLPKKKKIEMSDSNEQKEEEVILILENDENLGEEIFPS